MLRYGPGDFPPVKEAATWPESVGPRDSWTLDLPAVERAKRYLASVPPAIAGSTATSTRSVSAAGSLVDSR